MDEDADFQLKAEEESDDEVEIDKGDVANNFREGIGAEEKEEQEQEQQSQSQAAKETSNSEDGTSSRKRARGPTDAVAKLLRHYTYAYVRGGNKYQYCIYCTAHKEKMMQKFKAGLIPFNPPDVRGIRQRENYLKNHLNGCQHYLAFKKSSQVDQPALLPPGAAQVDPMHAHPLQIPALKSNSSDLTAKGTAISRPHKGTKPNVAGTLHQYMIPAKKEANIPELHQLLVEWLVDHALPFSMVESQSFHRVINWYRPGAAKSTLVGSTVMSERILNERYNMALTTRNEQIADASQKGHYVGIIVDGWEATNRKTLERVMLKAGPASFLLAAITPGDNHHGLAVARMWESIIDSEAKEYLPRLRYFLSDDAHRCARARRILALRHPHIVWIKCWAHQVNLIVGKLMKNSHFAGVCNKAVKAATAIRTSTSKWYKRLRDICERIYGKKAACSVFTLADTRWNSLQACFASLLRIKKACKSLQFDYMEDSNMPDAMDVFGDETFWSDLKDAELLVRPLCHASFLMQREGNTLAHVLVMIVNIHYGLKKFNSTSPVSNPKILADIRKRWKEAEQPLYVLAFCLHPAFYKVALRMLAESEEQKGIWMETKNPLCISRLISAGIYYYRKHELWMTNTERERKDELYQFKWQLFKWLKGLTDMTQMFRYSAETYPHPVLWFNDNADWVGKKLANFAHFILDCPVQGATCERLFKDFAKYLSRARNWLGKEKLLKSTMIKYDLRAKYADDKNLSNPLYVCKNSTIVAEEHKRIDEDIVQTEAAVIRIEDNMEEDPEDSPENEFAVEENPEFSAELEEFIPPAYDQPELRTVLAAIWHSMAEDPSGLEDAMESDDEEMETARASGQTGVDMLDMARRLEIEAAEQQSEMPPERPLALQPLPLEDVKTYPQENDAYLKQHPSIRTDKYRLESLQVCGFPTILQCFGDYVAE